MTSKIARRKKTLSKVMEGKKRTAYRTLFKKRELTDREHGI